jgi:DNA-directed RNA polymerase subunit RPC12/RpoP
MTTGALQYSCPKCGNPLFFTFKVEDAREKLTRKIHCPGCNTLFVADVTIAEGAK